MIGGLGAVGDFVGAATSFFATGGLGLLTVSLLTGKGAAAIRPTAAIEATVAKPWRLGILSSPFSASLLIASPEQCAVNLDLVQAGITSASETMPR